MHILQGCGDVSTCVGKQHMKNDPIAITVPTVQMRWCRIIVLVCILATPVFSMQSGKQEDIKELQSQIDTLKGELQAVKQQQREILDQVHLLGRSDAGINQIPSTLKISAESLRGGTKADIAIIEYTDFECP